MKLWILPLIALLAATAVYATCTPNWQCSNHQDSCIAAPVRTMLSLPLNVALDGSINTTFDLPLPGDVNFGNTYWYYMDGNVRKPLPNRFMHDYASMYYYTGPVIQYGTIFYGPINSFNYLSYPHDNGTDPWHYLIVFDTNVPLAQFCIDHGNSCFGDFIFDVGVVRDVTPCAQVTDANACGLPFLNESVMYDIFPCVPGTRRMAALASQQQVLVNINAPDYMTYTNDLPYGGWGAYVSFTAPSTPLASVALYDNQSHIMDIDVQFSLYDTVTQQFIWTGRFSDLHNVPVEKGRLYWFMPADGYMQQWAGFYDVFFNAPFTLDATVSHFAFTFGGAGPVLADNPLGVGGGVGGGAPAQQARAVVVPQAAITGAATSEVAPNTPRWMLWAFLALVLAVIIVAAISLKGRRRRR